LALQVANESGWINREVFLVGDNQAGGWEGRGADLPAWEGLSKLARVVLLPVREGVAANGAVEWVQAARGLSTIGASTRIQARVVNKGPQPLRGLSATLEIDGKAEGTSQRLDLEPGQGSLVAFNQIFDKPGVRTCTVRITADRLASDDVGYLALRVRQNVKVLVVNGKPDSTVPQKDAGFFLNLALSPPITAPGAEPTPLEPRVVTGASFGGVDVRGFDVVALSNVSNLGDSDRRLLAEFVQNGGGALFFLGDKVNPDLYNRDLLDAKPSLLPARLNGTGETKTSLDAASLDHPALQRFRGAADVDLGTAQFTKYFKLAPVEGDKSIRVMARFTDGSPAMVERQFGLGKVILVASGATTEWNTLPLKPAFLPMIHQLVAYLATGTDGTRNGTVGEPLVKPLPLSEASRKVTISDPSAAKTSVKPLVDERGATVTLEHPQKAGFYRLDVQGGTQDVFAVNRDVAESDLKSLSQEALKKVLTGFDWGWIGLNEDLVSALTRARQGVELWRHLLLAALFLMALETMLAQMFGRRS
jgi:hypothetical protein